MKNSKKGISLIVLIITIIVIIILATAILVSVISNNPISEANKARYESDRDNMQAVFTNTVGKIMAENQGVVNVTAEQINTETTGVNEATGEVAYTVDNATVAANASGTIKFDKGTNYATTYYTGKKLPIYAAGETKWYVDSEGVLSVEVAGVKYGSGEVEKLTYTSLGNYEHQLSDGTIENHDTESGTCSLCGETVLAPGLYDENENMTNSWEQLIADGDLAVTNGMLTGKKCSDGYGYLFPYEGKLIIDNSVTSISDSAFGCPACFSGSDKLIEIIIPNSLKTIGDKAFFYCSGLISISISNNVSSISGGAFYGCSNLVSIKIPDSTEYIGPNAFAFCSKLKSIYIPINITTIEANERSSGLFHGCSSTLKIYTGVKYGEKPSEWGLYWNYRATNEELNVTYGVTREQYEALIAE